MQGRAYDSCLFIFNTAGLQRGRYTRHIIPRALYNTPYIYILVRMSVTFLSGAGGKKWLGSTGTKHVESVPDTAPTG